MKKAPAALAFMMLMAGCSQDTRTVDERYIDSLKKSLESRWESETLEPGYGNGEFPVDSAKFTDSIDEQIKELEPYTEESFENAELQKAAEVYFSSLQELQRLGKYINTDPNRFYLRYEQIQEDNDFTLSEINSISPLEFTDEDDQVRMEKILDQVALAKSVEEMTSAIQFETVEEVEGDGYYFAELPGTIKNTTDYTFKYVDVDFDFLDEEGKTVLELYESFDQFTPGQEQKFTLITDQKYSDIKVSRVNCLIPELGYAGNIFETD